MNLRKVSCFILLRIELVENVMMTSQKMYTGEIRADHKGGKIKPFGYGKSIEKGPGNK